LSFAIKLGIATEGGSGLAVGKAEGEGDGLGDALPPPKSPACADGVVVAIPNANARATNAMSESRFKKEFL
jgi:hypothetical protein